MSAPPHVHRGLRPSQSWLLRTNDPALEPLVQHVIEPGIRQVVARMLDELNTTFSQDAAHYLVHHDSERVALLHFVSFTKDPLHFVYEVEVVNHALANGLTAVERIDQGGVSRVPFSISLRTLTA